MSLMETFLPHLASESEGTLRKLAGVLSSESKKTLENVVWAIVSLTENDWRQRDEVVDDFDAR